MKLVRRGLKAKISPLNRLTSGPYSLSMKAQFITGFIVLVAALVAITLYDRALKPALDKSK